MNKSTTSNRLKLYMEAHNLRQSDIMDRCLPYMRKYGVTMSKASLSQYLSGRMQPKQDKLFILGKALGVSEAWLMGFDVPMEPTRESQDEKNELKMLFSSLNDDGKKKVLEYLRDIVSIVKYTQ